MAKGVCYKWRDSIGVYPDGPMLPDDKFSLTKGGTNYEPAYTKEYLSKVNYDLWLGPAPERAFNRNRFHYNWHWHWDYGDGDTGKALVAHPDVNKIAFTGSTEVGKAIRRAVAGTGKKLSLELGGKSPNS